MTTALKLRRGTTSQHSSFTGANGEVTVDTTKKTVVVHDGATAGGTPLAKENNPSLNGNVSTTGLNFDSNTLVIDATNNNVGIGTASPAGKLHVFGGNDQILASDGTSVSILGASGSTGYVGTTTNHPFDIYTNATNRIRIDSSGKVGIGTSSPSDPIHVNSSGLSSIGLTGGATLKTDYRLRQGITGVSNGGFSLYDVTNNITTMAITSDGILQFNSGYGSAANAYGCRAWVNFNNKGTPSIRASGNVSSITDNGAGIFTVNFQNAMPNTNYCVSSWVRSDATSEAVFGYLTAYSNGTKTTSSMQFLQGVQNNGVTYSTAESTEVDIAFFR